MVIKITVVTDVVIMTSFSKKNLQHLDNRPTLRAAFRNSCDVSLQGALHSIPGHRTHIQCM